MATQQSWVESNTQSRERLRAVVARLSEADLNRPLGEGWTVGALLAHIAFWDYRILAIAKRWAAGGEVAASPVDVDAINAAALPLCLAIPGYTAARLVLAAAEATDERVATLATALLERNAAAGSPLKVWRSEHRNEHLDQLEAALGRAAGDPSPVIRRPS